MIKVVGVGGGGSNSINHMITSGVCGVDFIIMNTDKNTLIHSEAPVKLFLGDNTNGYLEGNNPDIGVRAAKTSAEKIASILKGADVVMIVAEMGGTIGTR